MPFTINQECQLPRIESEYRRHYRSTVQNDFTWKYKDPEEFSWPCVRSSPPIKVYDDKNFKQPPKPLRPPCSLNNQEYIWKTKAPETDLTPVSVSNPIKQPNITLNSRHKGYAKYLDLMATTNMLDYPNYSSDDLRGIANNDHITAYSWMGYYNPTIGYKTESAINLGGVKQQVCQEDYSEKCPKRREFTTTSKPVPNTGMNTEIRDNYKIDNKVIELNMDKIKLPTVYALGVPIPKWSTESQSYGSGKRVQFHVNITNPMLHILH